jgi:6-phosphogluconolactonase
MKYPSDNAASPARRVLGRRQFTLGLTSAALGVTLLPGCGGGDDDDDDNLADHTVYVMTNAAANNQILAYRRQGGGTLSQIGVYSTGGDGLGSTEISPVTPQDGIDVLASQGAIQFTPDRRFLLAVNAGSNTVASFRVDSEGALERVDVESSGGLQPNAIAALNGLAYVNNVGGPEDGYHGHISGFIIGADGALTPLSGSMRDLSDATAQASALSFSPDGDWLVVSELVTDRITVFPVNADGTLGDATVNESSGAGPFGSVFLAGGQLIVTEAQVPGVPGSVSSYSVGSTGELTPISASISNGQGATCWTMLSPDGRRLYTSNTATGTVSYYAVGTDGTLTLQLSAASSLEGPSSGPIDGGVSEDGKYLYVLDSGIGAITALRINDDGSLTKIQTVTGGGLPTLGAQGLLVR